MEKCVVLFLFILIIVKAKEAALQDKIPSDETFHEELYVKTLPADNLVSTYFQFTTKWHYGLKENLHNTRLIPRAIAEILLQYDVKELHIGLTQGLWRYERWGYPVVDAPPGAEAWAWFASPNLTETQVDEQWKHLASTFSGILCASLNFIDKTNSIEPKYGFRPEFVGGRDMKTTPKFLRYASLPREIVCTENLTPWKKLLPCNSKYGFASLLNSGHIHNTNYHSLGIKMRTLCEGFDSNCVLEFTETASLVYDPKLLGSSSNEFSLRRFFGQGLNGHCHLAESSKIYISLNDDGQYDVTPEPMYNITSIRGGITTRYGVYDMKSLWEDRLFNIAWVPRNKQNTVPITPLPPLYAHRYTLGKGQERGKIVTQITNNHYGSLPIVFQENIPWFVPVYMHTLEIRLCSENGHSELSTLKPRAIHYVPGQQRTRPYQLEILFDIPAKSVVRVSFDFDHIFLKWLEYPPDANHGHYLGSAIIATQLPVGRNYSAIPVDGSLFRDSFNASRPSYFLQLRTESLILSLPTPDFSMPYNVICLACTVVALAFGPIHSVATKRIIIEARDAGSNTILSKVLRKLLRKKDQTVSSEQANLVDGEQADDGDEDDEVPLLIPINRGQPEPHEKSE